MLLFTSALYAQQGTVIIDDGVPRLLTYLAIKASDNEKAELATIQQTIENNSLPADQRVSAFHLLLYKYATLLKQDTTGLKKSIQSWGSRQTVRGNLPVFEELTYEGTPFGSLVEIKKMGSGPIPVILIPEYRKNWSVYEDLMQHAQDRYTYYAITLPGYNNTPAYALPKMYDFSNRVWLNSVVDGIISLIKKEKLKKPVIVGALNAGSYIGTNVLAKLKGNTRGLLLLNGALYSEDEKQLSPEERAVNVNSDFSNVMWYLLRRYKFSEQELNQMAGRKLSPYHPIYYYTLDTVKVKSIYKMHNSFRSLMERYDLEWQTADLTKTMAAIKTPVLVVLSQYDDAWPFGSKTNSRLAQWNSLKSTFPKNNVSIAQVKNARLILSIDRLPETITALDSFVEGKSLPQFLN